ncbi:MAG TPA: DUF58 domain-containing protein [Acidimicrobiales bacterium]
MAASPRRVTVTTRGAVVLVLAPASALAGVLAGAEELVLLAILLGCLMATGLLQSASRAQVARGRWRMATRLPASDIAVGGELRGVITLTTTSGDRAASVPTWLEDPEACWGRVARAAAPSPAAQLPRPNPSLALRVPPATPPSPADGAGTATLDIPLTAPTEHRGVFALRPVRHWCFDTFGFFAQLVGTSPTATITVYPVPAQVAVAEEALLGNLGNEDAEHLAPSAPKRRNDLGDFAGLRPYVPGDRLRLLYWPALARTGDLMVRDFEDEGPRRVYLVADVRALLGERGAERVLAAAAGVGRQVLVHGSVVELSTLTGDRTAIGPGPHGDLALLRALAAIEVTPVPVTLGWRRWWPGSARTQAPAPTGHLLAPMAGTPLVVTTADGALSLPGALRRAHLVMAP